MQIHFFPNKAFVIHKAIDGKTSAWFDPTGELLDAEFRDAAGRSREVIPQGWRWRKLEALGRIYKQ